MTITEEQFLRGVAAVERYRAMKDEIDAAMSAGGCNLDGLAGDGLLDELTDQISEHCPHLPQATTLSGRGPSHWAPRRWRPRAPPHPSP